MFAFFRARAQRPRRKVARIQPAFDALDERVVLSTFSLTRGAALGAQQISNIANRTLALQNALNSLQSSTNRLARQYVDQNDRVLSAYSRGFERITGGFDNILERNRDAFITLANRNGGVANSDLLPRAEINRFNAQLQSLQNRTLGTLTRIDNQFSRNLNAVGARLNRFGQPFTTAIQSFGTAFQTNLGATTTNFRNLVNNQATLFGNRITQIGDFSRGFDFTQGTDSFMTGLDEINGRFFNDLNIDTGLFNTGFRNVFTGVNTALSDLGTTFNTDFSSSFGFQPTTSSLFNTVQPGRGFGLGGGFPTLGGGLGGGFPGTGGTGTGVGF